MPLITDYKNLFDYMCKAMDYGIKKHGFSERKMMIYASHVPLLMTVANFFPCNRVIELGTGFFSTKIFYEKTKNKFVTIEDNEDWFNEMGKEFSPKNGFKLIKSPLDKFLTNHNNINPKDLPEKQIDVINKYYKKVMFTDKGNPWDIVFVDQIKYGRSLSIIEAKNKANIILFHDVRRLDFFNYQSVFDSFKKSKYSYFYYKTFPNWTGMLIRKDRLDFYRESRGKFKERLKNNEKILFDLVSKAFPGLSSSLNSSRFRFMEKIM